MLEVLEVLEACTPKNPPHRVNVSFELNVFAG